MRGSRPGVPVKPDPSGVYSLMADLGADLKTTLFVGDSNVDIATGHNAGLPALGAVWGFRGRGNELRTAGADELVWQAGGHFDVHPPRQCRAARLNCRLSVPDWQSVASTGKMVVPCSQTSKGVQTL